MFNMRKRTQQRKAARKPMLEMLEDRKLMAVTPLPKTADVLSRSLFDGQAAYDSAVVFYNNLFYGSGAGASAEGASNTVVNAVEIEPNESQATAQFVNFGVGGTKSEFVNIAGTARTLGDTDYFSFDLNKGDIIDGRLTTVSGNIAILSFYGPSGEELMLSTGQNTFPAPNSTTPRFIDGTANFTYIVDAPGRYAIRIGDQINQYSLNLRGYRAKAESQPAGQQPVLYLDFTGGLFNPNIVNLPPTVGRLTPMRNALGAIGLTAADEGRVIDEITNRVRAKFNAVGLTGTNGFFPSSGSPGDFGLVVTNSKDNPQVVGQPNVTRIYLGANNPTAFGGPAGLLGIAQSVDVGNFDLAENALVFLNDMLADAAALPKGGNATTMQAFAELVATVIAHEAGHTYGGVHQDPNNNVFGIMDQFYVPATTSGTGPDGLFGTPDDTPLQFNKDEFAPTIGMAFGGGVSNTIANMAFGLATSRQNGLVTGAVYNDRNRNGVLGAGEEGLVNQVVYADYNANGALDSGEPRTVTADNGTYQLGVNPGTWQIRAIPQTNWQISSAAFVNVTVGVGQVASGINFGEFLPNQAVTGFKWNDLNGNGLREANEPGMANVWIFVDLDGDQRIDLGEPSAKTAADGSYNLSPPTTGTYAIREVLEPGFVQTYPVGGAHIITFNGTQVRGLDFGNQVARDYGDAPANYPVLAANSGASSGYNPALTLGSLIDFEENGQPDSNALGDDLTGAVVAGATVDDEDGVTFPRPIVRGDTANVVSISVTNTNSTASFLSAWVDFNQNGSWDDPGEKIASDVSVTTSGTAPLQFTVPSTALLGTTFARFRLSNAAGIGSTGPAEIGEVEDYRLSIVNTLDYAVNDSFTVGRNSTNNVLDVLGNDFTTTSTIDQTSTITAVTQGTQGGRVSIQNNAIVFTPRAGFTGIETFTYTIRTSLGAVDTATVTVSTILQLNDPVAIEDSYDVPVASSGYPLNVLANDLQGNGGAVTILSFTQPANGSVVMGQGNLSLRYTPNVGFTGSDQLTYTIIDSTGKVSTANVTIHIQPPSQLNDQVGISFRFRDLQGNVIQQVQQGQQFFVDILADDLRTSSANPNASITNAGVYAAYIDFLYNSGLVATVPGTTSGFDFTVQFDPLYGVGQSGANTFPGLISALGAFVSPNNLTINNRDPQRVLTLTMLAKSAGLAEFVSDPANNAPQTDVLLFDTPGAAIPYSQVRYGRSTLEIVPDSIQFPFALDDSRAAPYAVNSFLNSIDVLSNDRLGSSPPISIIGVTQPLSGGTVAIDDNGTPNNPADDRLAYTPLAGFSGSEQFTYTIQDTLGFQSTATVTVKVGDTTAQEDLTLRYEIWRVNSDGTTTRVDSVVNGQKVATVAPGSTFQLRGYVQDTRAGNGPFGVFAAYQDILYTNPDLVTVSTRNATQLFTESSFVSPYNFNAISGDNRTPGLINELGSTQTGSTSLGNTERLQFSINVLAKAGASGQVVFTGDPSDVKPFNDSLLYLRDTALTPVQIDFDSITVNISSAVANTLAAGEGFTNSSNQFDVNNDGVVSPIDALVLINNLTRGGTRQLIATPAGEGEASTTSKVYLDVNKDGFLSSIDVLQVINRLSRSGGSGEGESSAITTPSSTSSSTAAEGEGSSTVSDFDLAIDVLATDVASQRRKKA